MGMTRQSMRVWIALLGAAAALALRTASAEELSWQFSGNRQSIDGPADTESDTSAIDATYYFQSVDDTLGPLELAPFLSRSSRITARIERFEDAQVVTYVPPGGTPVTSKSVNTTDVLTVSGRFVWQSSGWYVGGGYQWYDLDQPSSTSFDLVAEKDGATLVAGKYLGPATSLELTAASTKSRTDFTPLACSPVPFCTVTSPVLGPEIETEDLGLSVRHVGGHGRLRYSVTGGVLDSDTTLDFAPVLIVPGSGTRVVPPSDVIAGGVIAGDAVAAVDSVTLNSARIYSVTGELYPTARLGVRMGYTHYDVDSGPDRRYEVAATWFFKRRIAVEFAVARTKFSYGPLIGVDADEARIRLIGRH